MTFKKRDAGVKQGEDRKRRVTGASLAEGVRREHSLGKATINFLNSGGTDETLIRDARSEIGKFLYSARVASTFHIDKKSEEALRAVVLDVDSKADANIKKDTAEILTHCYLSTKNMEKLMEVLRNFNPYVRQGADIAVRLRRN